MASSPIHLTNHYENVLASTYSWIYGDYASKLKSASEFLLKTLKIKPIVHELYSNSSTTVTNLDFDSHNSNTQYEINNLSHNTLDLSDTSNTLLNTSSDSSTFVIDLGCGNGFYSIPMAQLGFNVDAFDLSPTMLKEFRENIPKHLYKKINIQQSDIVKTKIPINKYKHAFCLTDTITSLESISSVFLLLENTFQSLIIGGRIHITFRDLSKARVDTNSSFIVKNTPSKIFNCNLYFNQFNVLVTDTILNCENNQWKSKSSSYFKLRLSPQNIENMLIGIGFTKVKINTNLPMVYITGIKETQYQHPQTFDQFGLYQRLIYASANGFSVIPKPWISKKNGYPFCIESLQKSSVAHMPFAYHPMKLSNKLYTQCRATSHIYHSLVIGCMSQKESLFSFISKVCCADPDFSYKLFQLAKNDPNHTIASLGVFRNDFLVQNEKLCHVEFNTISAALFTLATILSNLHRQFDSQVPENPSRQVILDGFLFSHRYFEKVFQPQLPLAVVFVVQSQEFNLFDQNGPFQMFSDLHIPVFRKTLNEIYLSTKTDSNNHLILNHQSKDYIISLVYFRAGYTPKDYPTQIEWDARKRVEYSTAIKCPTIFLQLVGLKKLQQLFNNQPHILEDFIGKSNAKLLLASSMNFWEFSSESTNNNENLLKMIRKNPQNYVLKPQREGGGNNLYDSELLEYVENPTKNAPLSSFILMERIQSDTHPSIFVQNGHCLSIRHSISEIGVFSALLIDKSGFPIFSQVGGTLVRSKSSHIPEGGISVGLAVMNSISLK